MELNNAKYELLTNNPNGGIHVQMNHQKGKNTATYLGCEIGIKSPVEKK